MADVVMHTGADLAAHICAEAAARGITPSQLLTPIFMRNAAARLNTIRAAKAPTAKTVEQVNSILTIKVTMPTATVRDMRQPAVNRVVRAGEPQEAEAVYVHRDPCFRCGTRADIGCRHRRPTNA